VKTTPHLDEKYRFQHSLKARRGFTLIEVMITITILGTLTILAAQAISQAIKSKVKLQDQIDDVSRMRDAIRLMERDINLAFHYRDVESELYVLENSKTANANPTTAAAATATASTANGITFGSPGINPKDPTFPTGEVIRVSPITQFIGAIDSVSFVTMNSARMVRNVHQGDFIEVGYSLKDCRSLKEGGSNSKCLWRRSSPYVDLDVTKGGEDQVLLENITEFKLRYFGKGKPDWVTEWRTDDGGDSATKGKFPQAVEISVTSEKKDKGKTKKYSMQVVVPIHFPNNPDDGSASDSNNSAPTSTGSGSSSQSAGPTGP